MTADLVAFLTARINEDQVNAELIHEYGCDALSPVPFGCDCGVPARVLADVTAKRAIIKKFERACYQADHDDEDFRDTWDDIASSLEQVLILLAQPFADHADFDPAWRP